MEPNQQHYLTFLDLSEVDEREQLEIWNSLYAENKHVQMPWHSKGKAEKPKPKPDHNPPIIRKTENAQEYPSPTIPNYNYLGQQQPFIHASSPIAYTQPISYTIQQQYVYYQPAMPQTYPHYPAAPNATFVAYPQSPINNIEYGNNGVQMDAITFEGPKIVEPIASLPPTQNDAVKIPKTSPLSVKEKEPQKEEVLPNQQNGTVPKRSANVTPSAKPSWASLFNSKSPNASVVVNGNSTDKTLDEAVNNETNNNEDPIKNPRFANPKCYRMGEFLLSHNLDGRTISLQPRGLINKSNYCYINSILQALLACPPMYNLLIGLSQQVTVNEKERATPIIDGMCRFVKQFQHQPAGLRVNRRNDKGQKKEQGVNIDYDVPFEPSWIYKILNGVRSDSFLVEGRQEDAEEFFGCLLNGLDDEMVELLKLVKGDLPVKKIEQEQGSEKEWQVMGPKNKGGVTRQVDFVRTPISDIFRGFLKSRICRTGDQSTYNIQPFFTLQLNIEKVKTVKEALEALVSKNQLEGLTSERTNEQVEAWQQVTLEDLPVVLVLHLKCFDFKLDGCTKILKALEFPIDLKIDSKLLSSKPIGPKEKQYKLFAVVYHDGKEATKGHYVTDAFHVGYSSWIRYDDSSVKPVQEDHVLNPQGTRVPYLLFYRRSDTIRSK